MEIKNKINNYLRQNDLKLLSINYLNSKGFVLITDKGEIDSSNLEELNHLRPIIKKELEEELKTSNLLEIIKRKMKINSAELINISIDMIDKKEIILHTTKGNITSKHIPELKSLSNDDLIELYEETHIQPNELQKVINNVINSIKTSITDILESYVLHSMAYDLNQSNIKNFLSNIEFNKNNPFDVLIHLEIFNRLVDELNKNKDLKLPIKDTLTGTFKADFYQKFLGPKPLKRAEDIKDITILNDHLKHINTNALMYCDMNNFKMINELLNHDSGDLVLSNFGKIIRSFSKDLLPIRKGGDEFVILGNINELKKLEEYMNSNEFHLLLNKGIYSTGNLNGKVSTITINNNVYNVEASVSKSIEILQEIDIKDLDSFNIFHKSFSKALLKAEKNVHNFKNEFKDFNYRDIDYNL